MVLLILSGDEQFFHPGDLQLSLRRRSALKAKAPSFINNRAFKWERLYLELHSRLRGSVLPCMDAVWVSGPRHSVELWGQVQVRSHTLSPWNLYSTTSGVGSCPKHSSRGGDDKHRVYCYSGKKTSRWDWPEPPRIITLIHQNIDQRSRRWLSEALIRKSHRLGGVRTRRGSGSLLRQSTASRRAPLAFSQL